MRGKIPARKPRENEVRALLTDDGRACIAIVKQRNGCFLYFQDQLSFDPDENVYYWNAMMNPASVIYESIEDAERDARLRYGFGPADGTGR